MSTYCLFVDIESTGLDPVEDEILEVGAILTDENLSTLATYEAVTLPGKDTLPKLAKNPFVLRMHQQNGLLDKLIARQLRESEVEGEYFRSVSGIEEDLILLVLEHAQPDDVVHIAGSGVAAFDQPFLRLHMPTLSRRLHYAPIDVGPSRRMWQWATGTALTEDNAAKTHRAMSDVQGHLLEARAIRDKFIRAQVSGG